jgi:hypothetical protein
MLLKGFFISASELIGHGRQHSNDIAKSQFDSFKRFNFNKNGFLHET